MSSKLKVTLLFTLPLKSTMNGSSLKILNADWMIPMTNQNDTHFIITTSMLENKNSKFIRVIGFRTCPSIIGAWTTIRAIPHARTVIMILVKSFGTSNDTISNISGITLDLVYWQDLIQNCQI